jgi:MFS family permease
MRGAPATRLWNRDFLLFWQGQLVSQIGSQAFAIATAFWVKHATGSASLVGLVMMLGTLPIVLLGPIGGVCADRVSRKGIIVACDAVAGLAVLSLAAVMAARPESTSLLVGWLCAVSLVVGVARAFFSPAVRAAIPALAPPARLAAANSLHEGTTEAAALVGQAAGGVAFRLLGAPVLLLVDGLSYLFAAVSTGAASIAQERTATEGGVAAGLRRARGDLAQGFRYVRDQRGLGALVTLAALVNVFAAPVFVMLPFFVEDSLAARSDLYGFLIAAFGAGGLAGYVLAGRAGGETSSRPRRLLLALVVIAASLALLGFAQRPVHALALLAVAGACNGFFSVGAITILQERTPDAVRGRVFGLAHTLAMGLTPLAMLITGVVAEATQCDARAVYRTCGAVLMVVTGVAWRSRALRDYLGGPRPRAS